jgi:hypothetical protein
MSIFRVMGGACVFALALTAQAACESPAMPAIPDGATAEEAEMVEAQGAVRAFVEQSNAYLDCLVGEAKQGEETDDATTKQKRLDQYNAGADAMQQVADGFNAELREFKAR